MYALLLAGVLLGPVEEAPRLEAPRLLERPRLLAIDDRSFYRDPSLSPEQKELLVQLQGLSKEPLRVESWPRAGAVGSLDLAVPSGLDPAASLEEHALSFLKWTSLLWKLESIEQLRPEKLPVSDECRTATFQLVHPSGLPVFGATISVSVDREGIVRGVRSRITGEAFEAPQIEGQVGPEQAAEALRRELRDARGKFSPPTPVLVDPYFLADGPHQPVPAWLFAVRSREGLSVPFAVSQLTGKVVVSGPGLPFGFANPGCGGAGSAVVFPEVVLDPATGTPRYVGFAHFGGLVTSATTDVDRAYEVLSSNVMRPMYGDGNPWLHLRDAVVTDGTAGRRHVRLREYYAGLPVEGAHLTVTLRADGRGENVAGRFVTAPNVDPNPKVNGWMAEGDAFMEYLWLECGSDLSCQSGLWTQRFAAAPALELVVFPSELFPNAAIKSGQALAWKIDYPRRTVYWDANAGARLYDAPKVHSDTPYDLRNLAQSDRMEIQDGVAVAGVTPDAEATAVANLMPTLDAFYIGLGRDSYDDANGRLTIHVRLGEWNAYWSNREVTLGDGFATGDVLGHEYTHGVTQFSSNLVYDAESGALNESYSDVMGNLAFPDAAGATNWMVGEDVASLPACGGIRNMVNPGACGHPSHVGLMSTGCLGTPDRCVHTWSGVPNRAAVLIADGGVPSSSHGGLGRPTLARIYYDTLVNRLGMTSQFVDQRVATLAACRALVNQTIGGRTLTSADCDHVASAFDAVGIVANTVHGWTGFSTGLFGGGLYATIRNGLRLYNGCTIADHTLWGMDQSGQQVTSNVAGGLLINFNNGEWGAYVTDRGAATDPADRSVTYRLWSTWFKAGVVDVFETINQPAGVTDCFAPAPGSSGTPRHARTLYSAARVAHWATFLNGGKGDDAVNAGVMMPAGCEVQTVLGVDYHGGVLSSTATASLGHGAHGFDISRNNTDPRSLDTNVHWWHDGWSGIFVRVVYSILEDQGVDCSVPGATQDTP